MMNYDIPFLNELQECSLCGTDTVDDSTFRNLLLFLPFS